jgi:2'-5' RNA ligase
VSRLFVAAELPDEVRRALLAAVDRRPEPGVRWVPPEQWHVTLRFLGDADEADAAAALDGVDAPPATAVIGPRVSRLGRTVVCLPVAGLDELAASVAAATATVGQPEDRRFAGHLTLARLRRRAACGVTGTPFRARFEVGEVVLVRSTLDPDGARHEIVRRHRLGPPGG